MKIRPLSFLIGFTVTLCACGEVSSVHDDPSAIKPNMLDNHWRKMEVDGCIYIVNVLGPEAIVHAGSCPNHDTTNKAKGGMP